MKLKLLIISSILSSYVIHAQNFFVKASPGISFIKSRPATFTGSLSGVISGGIIIGKSKLLGVGPSIGYIKDQYRRPGYVPVGIEVNLLPGTHRNFWPLLSVAGSYPIHNRKGQPSTFGKITGNRMSTITAGIYLPGFSKVRMSVSGSYHRIIVKTEKLVLESRYLCTNAFSGSVSFVFL